MERIPRIPECCRPERARLGFMKVRMKDHMRPAHCRPANRLRIAPPFVTNHHSECQRPVPKQPAIHTWRVRTLLRGIDLNLVLEARQRPIGIDDQRRRDQRVINDPLRPQHDRNATPRSFLSDRGPCLFE
jgi:hypothetical protein